MVTGLQSSSWRHPPVLHATERCVGSFLDVGQDALAAKLLQALLELKNTALLLAVPLQRSEQSLHAAEALALPPAAQSPTSQQREGLGSPVCTWAAHGTAAGRGEATGRGGRYPAGSSPAPE